ncbi:MAG: ABC transporter ATP-binding protein [Rhodobacteraceae bacterium]|nr:ABC transporter ATP-binding protein [Paracoccaceae bacterium]
MSAQPAHDDTAAPALRVQGLRKSFTTSEGPLTVLDGVSLQLERGESLALTGESGSGKSTLLHICAGLEPADGGTVEIDGRAMSGASDAGRAALRRGGVGLVFQQFNLIPSLTVAANLSFQARLAGRHDPDFTADLAARLGIEALMRRYPEQLSGGQQQRVAVGRCLAARPALVLADEPTGNLDEATGDTVLDLLLDTTSEAGAALLLVTHSPRLAARCGARAHLRAGRLDAP